MDIKIQFSYYSGIHYTEDDNNTQKAYERDFNIDCLEFSAEHCDSIISVTERELDIMLTEKELIIGDNTYYIQKCLMKFLDGKKIYNFIVKNISHPYNSTPF